MSPGPSQQQQQQPSQVDRDTGKVATAGATKLLSRPNKQQTNNLCAQQNNHQVPACPPRTVNRWISTNSHNHLGIESLDVSLVAATVGHCELNIIGNRSVSNRTADWLRTRRETGVWSRRVTFRPRHRILSRTHAKYCNCPPPHYLYNPNHLGSTFWMRVSERKFKSHNLSDWGRQQRVSIKVSNAFSAHLNTDGPGYKDTWTSYYDDIFYRTFEFCCEEFDLDMGKP